MTLPDIYIDQDTPQNMYKQAGLDADSIVEKVFSVIGRDQASRAILA
jgi:1-deoxy-D-xylulose-5-phosphate synthase